MWEESVITNAGAALLEQWTAQGGTLTIDGAKAGTGTVPALSLLTSTQLASERQTLSIVNAKRLDTGAQYTIQFSAADNAYTAHQIGIFAHLDNAPSVLFALYQDADGVHIPSKAEMQEFVYLFYAVVAIDHTGEIHVALDSNAYLTLKVLEDVKDELNQIIDDARGHVDSAVETALQDHNNDLRAHEQRRHVIKARVRDSWRPDYGLGGGWDGTAAIETGPYTGDAEISVIVNDTEYDAKNMTQNADNARNGDLIITKTVEE